MSQAPPEPLIYLSRDGQQFGPYSIADLKSLYGSGRVLPTDFLWSQGFSNWLPAAEVLGIAQAPVPPPPPEPRLTPSGLAADRSSSSTPRVAEPVRGPATEATTQTVIDGGSFKFSTFLLIVLGLIIPLWPISLPLFWFLAYRSYKKPSVRTVRVITERA
jgi:hypothetical protein